MARLWGRRLFLVASWAFVAGAFVQIYLAGMGVFAGSFDNHRSWGYMLGLFPLLMIVFGLIGRIGRRDILLSALLFLQGILQSVFVLQRESNPAVAALHPVNGVLMLVIGIYLAIEARRLLRADAEPAAQA